MTQELGPNQEKWLHELETTTRKQGAGKLRSGDDEYCCLGVGCELFEIDGVLGDEGYWIYNGRLAQDAPTELIAKLALYNYCGGHRDSNQLPLAKCNDNGMSFKEIAAIVRANPADYFSEPR